MKRSAMRDRLPLISLRSIRATCFAQIRLHSHGIWAPISTFQSFSMLQNADAQSRIAGAEPTSSAPNPPGNRLLEVAIVVYLIALATFVTLAALGVHVEANKLTTTVLLVVPVAFLGLTFGLCYSVDFISSLASVPLISFSNGLSEMQQNWRRIARIILRLAVVSAILTLGTA